MIKYPYSIVIPAESADVTKHYYSEVYGSNSGCTITINGQEINIGKESSINIKVGSVSGGVGCYLLGHNRDVFTGSPNLGSISVPSVDDNTINNFVENDYVENYFE
jgi:hypothetical protein